MGVSAGLLPVWFQWKYAKTPILECFHWSRFGSLLANQRCLVFLGHCTSAFSAWDFPGPNFYCWSINVFRLGDARPSRQWHTAATPFTELTNRVSLSLEK